MSENSEATAEHPLFPILRKFGMMARLEDLMIEGRYGEVLCLTAAPMGPFMGLTSSESDSDLLDALTNRIWAEMSNEEGRAKALLASQRPSGFIDNIIAMLKEGAPPIRIVALLEGLAYTQKSDRPRLHAAIMLNLLSEEAGLAKRPEAAASN